MNESYGIEIKAITEKFKEKMRNLSNDIRNFGKEAEKNVTISPTVNLKELYKWREEVEKLLQATREQQAFSTTKEVAKTYDKDIQWYETSLNAINDRIKEIEKSEEQVNETSEKSKSILSEMFDKSISKIKRFTFYLLGARSVFSLFMKYQGIYYQYNEQLQYQSELSQNAIALSLAPAFEFLGNVIAYASIAFAKFIELLTGVNVLSKVSTKGIRDYNKGLKESQTLLSGIDEITNLTLPTGTGLASQYQALDDFQKKVAEVEKFFQNIANKWEEFKNNFRIWFYGGDFNNFGEALSNAVKNFPNTMINLLKPIYDIAIDPYIIKPFEQAIEKLKPIWEPLVVNLETVIDDMKIKWENFVNTTFVSNIKNNVKNIFKRIYNAMIPFLNDMIFAYNNSLGIVFGQIKYIEQETENAENTIESKTKKAFDSATEYGNKKIKEIKTNLDDTFKDRQANVTFNVKGNTSQLDKSISDTLKKYGFSTGGGGILSLGGSGFIGGGSRGYANGLDYVPYDNYLALLHKGEAVVPAKYNPQIHSQGNDYTNRLLETLIIKFDDLSNRPNVFEIDGQRFANATYPLYEEERSRQNYLEGVVAK